MPATYYGPATDPDRRMLDLLSAPPDTVSIDVETISLEERIPIGFAIAFSPEEAVYFQTFPDEPRNLELLAPVLNNPGITKVCHNILFDLSVLPGIPKLEGMDRSNIWDTAIAARLLGKEFANLEFLAQYEGTGIPVQGAREMLAGKKSMLELPTEIVANKCQKDARACLDLHFQYKGPITRDHGSNYKVDMEVVPLLIDMSQGGLLLDQGARESLSRSYTSNMEFYRDQARAAGVDNPGSNQQVGYILAKRGNFLPLTKSKKNLATGESILELLEDPLAQIILGYRHHSKFLNTYLIPITGMDIFWTEYYMETSVGRMNSRDRNVQNIPLDARQMILPRKGMFTTFDYAQEHLYILAHFSGDRDMLRIYAAGGDIHAYTAEQMRITRPLAKTINYAIAYGATAKTISEKSKIRDIGTCSRLLDRWFRTFKGAADWITFAQREGIRDGWSLPTLFGRRIKLPLESEDGQRRKAINYPILGSDGEVIKRAMLLCRDRGLGPPAMSIVVHDSITFDGDLELPEEELAMIPGFRIPVDVKKSARWN